jgi:hypothetical protein
MFLPSVGRRIVLALVVAGGLLVGLGSAANAQLSPLPRDGWVASASATCGSDVPARALDGNASTRWSTGLSQANGQWFQVDMLSPRSFTQLTLDTAGSASDYPRGYQVYVSPDGSNWGSPVASGTASSSFVTITFPYQTARFFRIVQTGSASNWWSIHELNVYGSGSTFNIMSLPRTGWVATASASSSGDVPSRALDGSSSTRWTTGQSQANGQWFQVDMLFPQTFTQVTLNATNSNSDYPRGYQLLVSNDGATWGQPLVSGGGTAPLVTITVPSVTARYIRIVQTGAASNWWSIYELNVYGSAATTATAALPRTGWVASASAGNASAMQAIDGNLTTRWTTGTDQVNAQWFQLDLGTSQAFTQVVLDAGTSSNDFPIGYQVYVTDDPSSWGSPVAYGAGSDALLTITFPYQTARYLRVVQTGTGSHWWSIHEINVYGAGIPLATSNLPRTGWIASASSTCGSDVPARALDGNTTTRWSSGVPQVNGQWFQVDMLTPQTFTQVSVDTSGSSSDYPRGFQIYVSNDGSTWGQPVASGVGTSAIVKATFPFQVARYLRVVQTGSASSWWSIHELNVAGPEDVDLVGEATVFPPSAGGHDAEIMFQELEVPSDGVLSELALYVAANPLGGRVRIGIYADVDGTPGALLGQAERQANVGWNHFDVLPQARTSGFYWLAFQATDPQLRIGRLDDGFGRSAFTVPLPAPGHPTLPLIFPIARPEGFLSRLSAYATFRVRKSVPFASIDWIVTERYTSFPPPDPGPENLETTLDGCLSSSIFPIVSYQWTIFTLNADGTRAVTTPLAPSSSCKTMFTFPHQGIHQVRLDVVDERGTKGSLLKAVSIRNYVILSLGDSIASGEGNPDQPAFNEVVGQTTDRFGNKHDVIMRHAESWADRRCHRSKWSGPARAALALASQDPHSSVTFVSLACSGAGVSTGIELPYAGQEPGDATDKLPPQLTEARRLLCPHPEGCPTKDDLRPIDALLLQAGANDLGFGTILRECANPVTDCVDDGLFQVLYGFTGAGTKLASFYGGFMGDGGLAHELTNPTFGLNVAPARVYATQYPDPVTNDAGQVCSEIDLPNAASDNVSWLPDGVDGVINGHEVTTAHNSTVLPMNSEIASTGFLGWTPIKGIPEEFIGHGYCANDTFIRRYDESLTLQSNHDGTMHPNIRGHLKIANHIWQQLQGDLQVPIVVAPTDIELP